jgi:hypothetical protein
MKNEDFMGKTNYFLRTLPFSFNHIAACRSSLENIGKMSLILVFNKNLPPAHTELELDVLGVYSSKRKN